MPKAIDHTGEQYGDWLILKRGSKSKYWLCKCACGTICEVNIDNMKSGKSVNCQKCQAKKTARRMTTHGESNTRLYYVWYTMRKRCSIPSSKSYKYYGGRGIKVCDEWDKSWEAFRDFAFSHGYKEGLQIDRIDNNGNYCPENCRFVTKKENSWNTRKSKTVIYKGGQYKLPALADMKHLKAALVADRIRHGWSVEESVEIKPVIGNNQLLRRTFYEQALRESVEAAR